ncbi:MAG: heme ABC transporter ATP-binding protein [Pseudomonadota bacterium]
MTVPIVAARNITYAVGDKILVEDVTVTLERGRLTAVIGPNGAGKSTLLRILAGELTSNSGNVRYLDQDVRSLSAWQLALRRAVMAQTTRLAFAFSVKEIAALGIDSLGRRASREARQALVATALEKADVGHLADRIYQTLSGGEQQRVQFARALTQLWAGQSIKRDQALLLDEPIAHLDMRHQLALMDAARAQARDGVAVLVTIHDLNLAAAYADHLLVLNRGRLVAQGRPHEVLTSRLLAEVFGVDAGIGEAPPGAVFVLPHRHAERRAPGSGTNPKPDH